MMPRTHLRVGTQTYMANIWGAHGGDCGDYLPEYKAAQLDRNLPTFRRKALPHFYGIWRRQVPLKYRRTSTRLYDVISKKTMVLASSPSFPKGTHFIKHVGFFYVNSLSYYYNLGRKRVIYTLIYSENEFEHLSQSNVIEMHFVFQPVQILSISSPVKHISYFIKRKPVTAIQRLYSALQFYRNTFISVQTEVRA